jgi:membrane-bound lytic murein transglycosylase
MRVFLSALFYLLGVVCLQAHAVHTSTAEAEYNAKTKKLEVSLTVFVSDLELALVRQSERKMKIDKTPEAEFDAQIQAYLAKTFVVTDGAGKVAKMRWVGREMDEASAKSGDPAVMLFFEVEMPEGAGGTTLKNAVFQELFKDQVNLMQMRDGAEKTEMIFTHEHSSKELGVNETKPPKS